MVQESVFKKNRIVPDDNGDSDADGYAEKVHNQHGVGQNQAPGGVYGPIHGHPHPLSRLCDPGNKKDTATMFRCQTLTVSGLEWRLRRLVTGGIQSNRLDNE
jgi:hypothetical protein